MSLDHHKQIDLELQPYYLEAHEELDALAKSGDQQAYYERMIHYITTPQVAMDIETHPHLIEAVADGILEEIQEATPDNVKISEILTKMDNIEFSGLMPIMMCLAIEPLSSFRLHRMVPMFKVYVGDVPVLNLLFCKEYGVRILTIKGAEAIIEEAKASIAKSIKTKLDINKKGDTKCKSKTNKLKSQPKKPAVHSKK
jgi:hypothetical protein